MLPPSGQRDMLVPEWRCLRAFTKLTTTTTNMTFSLWCPVLVYLAEINPLLLHNLLNTPKPSPTSQPYHHTITIPTTQPTSHQHHQNHTTTIRTTPPPSQQHHQNHTTTRTTTTSEPHHHHQNHITTIRTTSPKTQCQQYLSCYWPDLDQIFKVGSWDPLSQFFP